MRIMEAARPGVLRWTRYIFPGGRAVMVLQQRFETKWIEHDKDGKAINGGFDLEWRDVPIFEQPYGPCADGNVPSEDSAQ